MFVSIVYRWNNVLARARFYATVCTRHNIYLHLDAIFKQHTSILPVVVR